MQQICRKKSSFFYTVLLQRRPDMKNPSGPTCDKVAKNWQKSYLYSTRCVLRSILTITGVIKRPSPLPSKNTSKPSPLHTTLNIVLFLPLSKPRRSLCLRPAFLSADSLLLRCYAVVLMVASQIFPLGLFYVDYLLGLSDLTGELMRFAITSIGRQGMMSKMNLDKATKVCNFVRTCRSGKIRQHSPRRIETHGRPCVQNGRP